MLKCAKSPSVAFLVKMPQSLDEVVHRVGNLLSGHRLRSQIAVCLTKRFHCRWFTKRFHQWNTQGVFILVPLREL